MLLRGRRWKFFGSWSEVIDRAWQLGAHLVSDEDGAIAAGIELVYGGEAPPPVVRVSPAAGVPAEHWGHGVCGSAAAVGRGQSGGSGGICGASIAGDGWHGGVLVREGVVQRTASFGDGGRRRIGRRRVWSGIIGGCGGGRSWGRCGRSTTCWRCCQRRACSTKPPKPKRYRRRPES